MVKTSDELPPSPTDIMPFKPRPYLVGSFDITLHSRLAQNLFWGSWKLGRLGLRQFARTIHILWKAKNEDDPYAEWYLLKIYEVIEKAIKETKQHENVLQEQFQNLRGFKINLFTNETPLQEKFLLTSPFVFLASLLIEHIDYVARQLFTLMRMGLMPKNNLTPTDLYRTAQQVFSLPREWQYTGVTRTDIRENNQKAQKAYTIFGQEAPLVVLNQEIQFAFFPKER